MNRPFYLAVVGTEVEVTNGFSANAMYIIVSPEALVPVPVPLHLKPLESKSNI
jgi:hypothetical protein